MVLVANRYEAMNTHRLVQVAIAATTLCCGSDNAQAQTQIKGDLPSGTKSLADLLPGYRADTSTRRLATVPLYRDKQSELYYVNCQLTGKKGKMDARLAVDTGCVWLILSDLAVDTLGLTADTATTSAGPPHKGEQKIVDETRPVLVDQVVVGNGFSFNGPPAYRWDTRIIRSLGREQIDGILGIWLFGYCSFVIDFQRMELTIRYPSSFTPEELKSLGMDGATEIPIEVDDYDIWLTADLGGRKERMRLDTGSFRTGISAGSAKALVLAPGRKQELMSAYGKRRVVRTKLPKLSIGPFCAEQLEIDYPDNDKFDMPPLLGLDFLAKYRILIDYPNKKLFLKPCGEPATGR